MTRLCSVHFALRLILIKQVMSEAHSKLFLKNGKTISKPPIMESQNLLTENLRSTAVDFEVSENEIFWEL